MIPTLYPAIGPSRDCTKRGVTLLEVLLSMSILVFLSGMTYWFYSSALSTRESDTLTVQRLQLMRVTLRRIATEIRQASQITSGDRVGIRGEAERIWLSSFRTPSKAIADVFPGEEDYVPREFDMVKVEYKIARHPDLLHDDGYPMALGLARVEHLTPRQGPATLPGGIPAGLFAGAGLGGEEDEEVEDPLYDESEGEAGIGLADEIQWEQLYSKEIRHLRFCYYDGSKWWDDWDIRGENPLPQLVQVTIGFEERPPMDAEFGVKDLEAEEYCTCMNREPPDCLPQADDQYTIVVRIPQADPLFRSRVGREVKSISDELGQGEEGETPGESGGGGTGKTPGRTGT